MNPSPILEVKNFELVKILDLQKDEERLERLRNPNVIIWALRSLRLRN